MPTDKKQLAALTAAFFTVLFWSAAFPAVKFCLQFYSPESIMLMRFLVATAVLAGYCVIRRVPLPARGDLPLIALAGFVGIFLYMWIFNTGTSYVMSGVSSFIIASTPVFALILSKLLLKESAGLFAVVGITVSFLGLALVAASQVEGVRLNAGVWLLLLAALLMGFYNTLQRKILRSCSAIAATTSTFAFATPFMLVFLPKLLREMPVAPAAANWVLVLLGVFPAALSYVLWGYALSITQKTVYVTSFMYLTPFLAALLGFFWLGEVLKPLSLVGGFVIVAGMVITNWRTR